MTAIETAREKLAAAEAERDNAELCHHYEPSTYSYDRRTAARAAVDTVRAELRSAQEAELKRLREQYWYATRDGIGTSEWEGPLLEGITALRVELGEISPEHHLAAKRAEAPTPDPALHTLVATAPEPTEADEMVAELERQGAEAQRAAEFAAYKAAEAERIEADPFHGLQ